MLEKYESKFKKFQFIISRRGFYKTILCALSKKGKKVPSTRRLLSCCIKRKPQVKRFYNICIGLLQLGLF